MPRKKKLPVTIDTESNHVRINERGIITGLAVEPEQHAYPRAIIFSDHEAIYGGYAQNPLFGRLDASNPATARAAEQRQRQQQEIFRNRAVQREEQRRRRVADVVTTEKKDQAVLGQYSVLVEPGVIVRYDEQTVFEAKQFVNRENFGNHVPITDEYVHRLVAYAVYHRYHARDKTQTIEAAKPKAPIGKVHRRIKQLDLTPLEE